MSMAGVFLGCVSNYSEISPSVGSEKLGGCLVVLDAEVSNYSEISPSVGDWSNSQVGI